MIDRESGRSKETQLPEGFRIESFITTSSINETSRAASPLKRRTIEDVIVDWDNKRERFDAIWTFDLVMGAVIVDGQKVTLESKPYNRSGRVFPDGKVFSLEDAMILFQGPEYEVLRQDFGADKYNYIVQTRSGIFLPFLQEKGDRVVETDKLKGLKK